MPYCSGSTQKLKNCTGAQQAYAAVFLMLAIANGQFSSSDPKQQASLEASLKQKEEACREAEHRRVEVELRLVEVKESLKKVESGPFTLGTTLDSSLQDTPMVCALPLAPSDRPPCSGCCVFQPPVHSFNPRRRPPSCRLPRQHRQHHHPHPHPHPHHHRRRCRHHCPIVRGTTPQICRCQSTLPRHSKTNLPPSKPPKEKFFKKLRWTYKFSISGRLAQGEGHVGH